MDKYRNVSPEQAAFLRKQRNDRLQIRTIQWMLFAVFLISWELSSDFGCINSFIFCSPSIIGSCFIQMLRDGMLFQHIGITLLHRYFSQYPDCHRPLVESEIIQDRRTVYGYLKQPSEIRSGSDPDRLAGC